VDNLSGALTTEYRSSDAPVSSWVLASFEFDSPIENQHSKIENPYPRPLQRPPKNTRGSGGGEKGEKRGEKAWKMGGFRVPGGGPNGHTHTGRTIVLSISRADPTRAAIASSVGPDTSAIFFNVNGSTAAT